VRGSSLFPTNVNITSPHHTKGLHYRLRDLILSQTQSCGLHNCKGGINLLEKSLKVTSFRRRHRDFEKFFSSSEDVVYCNYVEGLFGALGRVYNSEEWRIFIDSSKVSLKAVLRHTGNNYPSVPLADCLHMKKKSHEIMRNFLNYIDYDKFKLKICGDLKVPGLLLGMQQGC
jgi:hypothetical protein